MGSELAYLAAIVEPSDDAIIGSHIVSWNNGAKTIYGYTAAEVIGRPVAILALPERKDEIASLQMRLHRGERIQHFQTPLAEKTRSIKFDNILHLCTL